LVTGLSNIIDVSTGSGFSLALNSNGKVFGFGKNDVNFF
jgi:alpha-tubulin suppressor-like RCC1 family protein